MSIKIIENNKPDEIPIKFNCDDKLSKKLEQYPMIDEHINKPNTTLFIGKMGSGKTSLLCQFTFNIMRKCFNHIYVFMPKTSMNSLDTNKFLTLPKDQIYEELTEESITDVYNKVQENAKEKKYSLVIFDDVQMALKNPFILKSLKNMIANQRHLKLVNFIILQNYISLDKSLRAICNNIFLFKLNKTQNQQIFDELIESFKDKFVEIMKMVYNEPFKWIFINITSQRLYSMYDEIIIKDNEDSNEK